MFNVRVYGLWVQQDHILLTREDVKGNMVIKFPGGGLEYGEGTADCLKREFMEELNCGINIIKHVFTTDFFVPSAFKDHEQVISIYYQVESITTLNGVLPAFGDNVENKQSFYWKPIFELQASEFTFPIDIYVVEKILQKEIVL